MNSDHSPPIDIVEAASKIAQWFEKREIHNWTLGRMPRSLAAGASRREPTRHARRTGRLGRDPAGQPQYPLTMRLAKLWSGQRLTGEML